VAPRDSTSDATSSAASTLQLGSAKGRSTLDTTRSSQGAATGRQDTARGGRGGGGKAGGGRAQAVKDSINLDTLLHLRALFTAADTDGDGLLDMEAFVAAFRGEGGGWGGAGASRRSGVLGCSSG
jgi:hypothetical protein